MLKRLIIGMLFLFFTGTSMAIEEPKYRVIEKSGEFELRVYDPKIIAEVEVSGNMKEASSAGFKLIADFIFGNNTSRKGGNETISMTSPVAMEPVSEKISMTSPVNMEQTGKTWKMHFVMPSEYTLDTLPKPNNSAVTVRRVAGHKYAVVRFSGFAGEDKVKNKTAELKKWLDSKNIQPTGRAEIARYNPPWTLPFLRRNEVMMKY